MRANLKRKLFSEALLHALCIVLGLYCSRTRGGGCHLLPATAPQGLFSVRHPLGTLSHVIPPWLGITRITTLATSSQSPSACIKPQYPSPLPPVHAACGNPASVGLAPAFHPCLASPSCAPPSEAVDPVPCWLAVPPELVCLVWLLLSPPYLLDGHVQPHSGFRLGS